MWATVTPYIPANLPMDFQRRLDLCKICYDSVATHIQRLQELASA